MSVKLRLQRQGRKRQPFYYIVVADSRAPRDGRYIDRVGSYNPNTDPATIHLDVDRSVDWLQKGAQPTDTVRAILSYKGAMYKHHLLRGVAKGVVKEEDVDTKFNAWLEAKEQKIEDKKTAVSSAKASKKQAALDQEAEIRAEREKAILAKSSPLSEEVAEGEEGAEEAAAEATEEAPAAEETATETAEETPAAEATEEAPAEEVAEEKAEEPAAEAAEEEAPAAEDKAEEAPAEETTEDAKSE